jgi:hypothetical protein
MYVPIDTSITDSIINNPSSGAAITATALAASNILPVINGEHIDPLFMDVLQAGAWGTTILVGILTIIGWIKKMFFDKRKTKNEPKHTKS